MGNILSRFFNVIKWLDIVILLLSVILKLIWVLSDPFWLVHSVHHPFVVIVGITAELFVVGQLVFEAGQRSILFAALLHLTFIAMDLIHVGHETCNCFGEVDVPAWALLPWNLLALATYIGIFVQNREEGCSSHTGRSVLPLSLGICCGLFLVIFTYADPLSLNLANRINTIMIKPAIAGEISQGSECEVSITILNASSGETRLIGANASCSCITFGEFPISLPARSSISVPIIIRISQNVRPTYYTKYVNFYTDAHPRTPSKGEVRFRVVK